MAQVIHRHMVSLATDQKRRLSDYCVGVFVQLPSRKSVKKAIKAGRILVNMLPGSTGDWLKNGDELCLLSEPKPPPALDLTLQIIFEDDFLAAVVKPAGLIVNGNQSRTLERALPANLHPSAQADALPAPKPVHRLDGATTGIVLVAKTAGASMEIGRQFERRLIKKKYQALVQGSPPENGFWEMKINGQKALTRFQTLKTLPSLRNGHLSLLDLQPESGRTHQLRIHCASAGFPIVGDRLYGQPGKVLHGKGLFLAAVQLDLQHPQNQQKLQISYPAPPKFEGLLIREYERWKKFKEA